MSIFIYYIIYDKLPDSAEHGRAVQFINCHRFFVACKGHRAKLSFGYLKSATNVERGLEMLMRYTIARLSCCIVCSLNTDHHYSKVQCRCISRQWIAMAQNRLRICTVWSGGVCYSHILCPFFFDVLLKWSGILAAVATIFRSFIEIKSYQYLKSTKNKSLSYFTFNKMWQFNLHHSKGKFSRPQFDDIFSVFPQKTGFDISCKLSPRETIGMKSQILFSVKKLENYFKMIAAYFLPAS